MATILNYKQTTNIIRKFRVDSKKQKQCFGRVPQKQFSRKLHKIHRKTPAMEYFSGKVAGFSMAAIFLWNSGNFTERHLAEHLRATTSKNIWTRTIIVVAVSLLFVLNNSLLASKKFTGYKVLEVG